MTTGSIKFVALDDAGSTKSIAAARGMTLLHALQVNDIEVAAVCGGSMACATCHVYLDYGDYARLPVPADEELALLSESSFYKPRSSRLSCQVNVDADLEGITIIVAPDEF